MPSGNALLILTRKLDTSTKILNGMSLNTRVLQEESDFADKAKYEYFRDMWVILLSSFFSIQE